MRPTISTAFTESERTRFRNLLELANSSKYQGERENALAAANRIAKKHDMSLDEAARWTPPIDSDRKPMPRQEFYQRPRKGADFENSAYTQKDAEAEKQRWQAAMDRAKDRGLDKAEEAKQAAQDAASKRRRNSSSRRNPTIHAKILIKETSLPIEDIADITGLNIYEVVGMKLKARNAA